MRGVSVTGVTVDVTITPTYSGCPAMSVIALDIKTALSKQGVHNVTLKTQIAPPWSTDWLSDKCRGKLEDYGIAPPRAAGGPERCPLCKSTDTGTDAPFACKAGVCSTSKCKVLAGEVEMVANHALEDYEFEAGFVLNCQTYPVTASRGVWDYDEAGH